MTFADNNAIRVKGLNMPSYEALAQLVDTINMTKATKRVGDAVAVQAEVNADMEKVDSDIAISEKRMSHAVRIAQRRNDLCNAYYGKPYMQCTDAEKSYVDQQLGMV